jgi:hypothetical protein
MEASEEFVSWAIAVVITLVLIGPPVLYALLLTFASDSKSFDRAVRNVEHFSAATGKGGVDLWRVAPPSSKEP